ncbi:MAG: sulfotransferase domain-containing protein [Verrucomicrobiota bacterium]
MSDPIPIDAYLLIIGAMKSGTSSLFHYLSQHPEICPARTKEPEYFSRKQSHRADLEKYSDLWNFDSGRHRYVMEASTGYTKAPHESGVPERIHQFAIKPKFIYILRDPFQRIESHYNFIRSMKDSPLHIGDTYYADLSDYFFQLEQYLEHFERSSILLLDFEDFRRNTQTVLKRICAFLEIGEFTVSDLSIKNQTLIPHKFMKSGPFRRLVYALPAKIRDQLLRKLSVTGSDVGYVRLSEEERRVIRNRLSGNMKNLREVFGFDISVWGFE